jgi:hypothetical protein
MDGGNLVTNFFFPSLLILFPASSGGQTIFFFPMEEGRGGREG